MNRMRAFVLVVGLIAVLTAGLAACAPKTNENPGRQDGESEQIAVVDFTWSEDSNCEQCHEKEVSSFQNAPCLSAQNTDAKCASCHADTTGLETAHKDATQEKAVRAALKTTKVDATTCETCHAQADIAAATADSVVLTDDNGVTVNPHAIPESTDHEELSCTNCHQKHVAEADITKKASRACASCHHAGVYECYTCHA